MIIPVSKGTYFNIGNKLEKKLPLCAYDMLYHPPDYNPKAKRSDRMEPKIIWRNIWEQEEDKAIPSTSHLRYGRPKWKSSTIPLQKRNVNKSERCNKHTRIYNVIEWVVNLHDDKPSICESS